MEVHIKNMVCPRCIKSVSDIFNGLNIETAHIKLGEVTTREPIANEKKIELQKLLKRQGFELLEDSTSKIISLIKSLLIKQVHHCFEPLQSNFSTFLSEQLGKDYALLSKLFSSVEGITIEKYILKLKVEKVKELIIYDEFNLSEIAFQLNYSSVAHLSSQFKKETGMTPTAFKKLEKRERKTLDSI